MTNLQDIITNSIGTGVAGYAIATGIRALGDYSILEAAKEPQTMYAAGICAAAGFAYGAANALFSGKRR